MLNVLFAVLLAQVPPPPPPLLVTPAPSASPASPGSPTPTPFATPVALVATPALLALHPNAQATLTITGATAPLTAAFASGLATVTIDQATQTLTVSAGATPGTDTLHVVDAIGAAVDVPLHIAFDAGTVPASLQLDITGTPIDSQWLAQQIRALVMREAVVQPGASVTVAPFPSPSPPGLGQQSSIDVPVQIAGNGAYFDVQTTTQVTIDDLTVEPFAPPVLMYDDDPERVSADGVLFRGTVQPGTPARLYFYHVDGPQPRRLVVMLQATGEDPTSIQVIDATAGANLDVMSVGHAVSRDFVQEKARNEGTVIALDSETPYVLHDRTMQPQQGVAGSIGLQVLSGGAVTVSVVAASPGIDPASLLGGPRLAGDGHHRRGRFSILNFGTNSLAYTVGGADAALVYADRDDAPRPLNPASAGRDYGDYGVIHTLLFSLDNPTAQTATVYLYEKPIGGIVRSSFLVDGNLQQIGCVRVSQPYQIAAFALAPQQKYQLQVQTMTDGGSNYPLEVGITGRPVQPVAPPLTAPDGCFPKPGGGL